MKNLGVETRFRMNTKWIFGVKNQDIMVMRRLVGHVQVGMIILNAIVPKLIMRIA